VTDILADDEARAYVFGRGGSLEFPFTVAAKTGTSQAYRDNWTVGYTREVTVGVWVGNFDRKALIGSSGVTGAGPIFHAVMIAAQQHVRGRDAVGEPIVARPRDLAEHAICELSGMRAGDACPLRKREWLPPGFSPLPCDWHHDSEEGVITLWPDRYREWAAAHRLLPGSDATLASSRVRRQERSVRLQPDRQEFGILSPADGATYLIDPTLRPDFQRLPLRASAARGHVEWRIDGQIVSAGEWPLARGVHLVTARDASGRTAEASMTIK
jgi:penicillin-binding protein 1C